MRSRRGKTYDPAMQRLQSYKFELRPNGQQERQIRRLAGQDWEICQ
ncbi:helix-turn-helix domain-containing protein [Pseudomonas sp. 3A(2025)]